jgi:hypothetical protein
VTVRTFPLILSWFSVKRNFDFGELASEKVIGCSVRVE